MAAKPKIKITASAPSKIILTGEHSVVNGYSAVAFTTNFRVYVSIEENGEKDKIGMVLMKNGKICQFVNWRLSQFDKFDGEDLDKNRFDFNERFLKMILGIENEQNQKLEGLVKKASVVLLAVLVSTGLSKKSIICKIETKIPIQCGMGSSAAYSVALIAASLKYLNTDFEISKDTKALINDLSFQCERLNHGKPSGIDNSVITEGGLILFSKNKIEEKLEKSLNSKFVFILIDSGEFRETKKFISKVQSVKDSYPELVTKIFETIDEISNNFWRRFLVENRKFCENGKDLLGMNQRLLECLQVSHPKLDKIVKICERNGFGAKLTGSGGGGAAFCMAES